MRKLKKQLLRTIIACGLVVSVAAGSTVAYLTDTETATNTFTVGNVQIDLEEPGYPGNDSDEVKNIIPNQEIVKDPQIENTGNNDALAFLRVEVPQEMFTDGDDGTGAQKKQDLFRLKGVSDQWELLRTETVTREDGKAKTSYVYGYKKTLGKGATTDKLFQKVQMKNAVESDLSGNVEDIVVTACAIQATDIPDVNLTPGSDGNLSKDVLDQVYTIFLNQSGNQTSRPADEGNRSQTGKLGKITYDLGDDAVLEGALSEYGTADYGYIPPTPVREGYKFMSWTPESIPADRDGAITFTANWKADTIGTIRYDLDGGTITGEKTEYTVEDYGYVPPTPVKKGYTFTGWSLESIPDGSTGEITFKSNWEAITATLLDGQSINAKMKRLSGNSSASFSSDNTSITAIQYSDKAPTAAVMADTNSLISTNNSKKPVYAWFDNGTIKWWSEAGKVSAGTDLSYLCYSMEALADISGLSDWNTENVTGMRMAFNNCSNLTNLKPLAKWNTGNVTKIMSMFENCNNLVNLQGLENWNTSKVTSMYEMFKGCSGLKNLNELAYWDVGNVTNMSIMFYNCSSLKDLNGLSNWDTRKVASISGMFCNCSNLSDIYGLLKWNTQNISNMGPATVGRNDSCGVFSNCASLTNLSGLTNWDTSKVTNMRYMFDRCSQLADLNGLSNWNTGKVADMRYMFENCSSLTDLDALSSWITRNVTNMYDMFCGCSSLKDLNGLVNWDTGNVTNMCGMFCGCNSLQDLNGLANWDVSKVTDMNSIFEGCRLLTDLSGLSNWDTGNVTNMNSMFMECSSLQNLEPISNWNTANVIIMCLVFKDCSALTETSGINSWNITKVADFERMFSNCPSHPEFTKRAGTWSDGTFQPTT